MSEFLSALLGAVVGAAAAYFFEHRRESQRRRADARLHVYGALLDIYSEYFWLTPNEADRHAVDVVRRRLLKRSLDLRDRLRESDDIRELPDILKVLFDERAYPSATDRYNAMSDLLDRLGEAVSPRLTTELRSIRERNVDAEHDWAFGMGPRPNAPALLHR